MVVDTQKEATCRVRQQAIREHVEVVIHKRDGMIRDSDSHCDDPRPPIDKKH